MSVQRRPTAGAGAINTQAVLQCQYKMRRRQYSSSGLPFTVVIVAIVVHCQVNRNGDNQSDEVDEETGQDHEGRTARPGAPGLVCLSRLVIADVHVCDGVVMDRREVLEKCRSRSLE